MTLKLERFDKKVLQLLENGELTLTELQARFKIAPLDFERRIKALKREKYIHFSQDEPPKIQLGLKGFNALEKRVRKTTIKPREKLASSTLQQPPKNNVCEEKSLIESKPFEIPREAGPAPDQNPPNNYNPLIHGPLKILSTEAASSPSAEQKPVTQEKQVPEELPKAAQKLNLQWEKEKEVCELCKAEFKLSLNPSENNPVYGHCFCGAAYHQDCYESLAQNSGKCVRCGRTIELKLDQKSQAALKQIKNLFD